MATIHGVAGEWARVKGTVLGLWPLFIAVFAVGFSLSAACFLHLGFGLVLTVLALVGCGLALQRGLRRVESFFKGAKGEERVSGLLACLPDSYHVFNDFVAGGTHVDHVVVGPAGVFSIETKCWAGRVTVEDGRILVNGVLPDRDPLRQALREAELVSAQLKQKGWVGLVTPVLAFASDTFDAGIAQLDCGVVVINSRDLDGSFEYGRRTMASDEADRLVGLMES